MKGHAGRLSVALWVTLGGVACTRGDHGGGDTAVDTDEQPAHLVTFTTSVRYERNLKDAGEAASGLEGADALCVRHARAAGLDGTWHAWLSDASADAIDRIEGDGPWHRLDGERAFLNHSSLAGVPVVPLDLDEYGRTVGSTCAWTNTHVGGHRAADCRWEGVAIPDGCAHEPATVDDPNIIATVGSTGAADGGWTDTDAMSAFISWTNCSLYCLQAP